jgi:GDPmannose 4,6-dehydratase
MVHYLAKLLLKKKYSVHGIKRRSSLINTFRIDELIYDKNIYNKKFFLHHGDLTDQFKFN